MNVEVLMSCMHQENFDIAYKTKVNSDLLIINQCDKNDYSEINVNGHLWRMISTTERGLSKSRNMALKNANGDICLLCDDDEELSEGYVNIITKAFSELNDATAIVFNLNRINYKMKKTYYKITKIKRAPKYRAYGSPMLGLKIYNIINNKISFNEKFGSGTDWGGGEDSLFIRDIKKIGTIYEYPEIIATIDYSNGSNWFDGYTEKYFYNLGAFEEYSNKNKIIALLYRLYLCFYKLRKNKQLSPLQKLKWMYLGAQGMKHNVTYKEFLAKRN